LGVLGHLLVLIIPSYSLMEQKDNKDAWHLIAKMLTGEATPQEHRELEQLLKDNPELHYPMQTISDLWKSSREPDKAAAESAYSRHLERIRELNIDLIPANRARTRRNLVMTGLSVLVLLSVLAVWRFSRTPRPAIEPLASRPVPGTHEIFTANGSRTHLTLPDGTLVWLNAGSRLTYGKNYDSMRREVTLTGEAFFEVAKNNQKPFLIHTDRVDIQVLGTSFNVKSYPSDKTTETTLIHGSIEVSIKARPSEKIILKPNQKLVVGNDPGLVQVANQRREVAANKGEPLVSIRQPTYEQATGAIIETSWVDNKLTFREESFGDVARQMERWYGITIRFTDPALEEMGFTGSFKEETIQQALDALRLTASFSYRIDGNQITINK